MKVNYHTHTFRCNHARGTERDYIEAAIKNGFEVLGFSDHAPYYFPDGYYSTFRMKPEQSKDYVDTLTALADEYSDRIKIFIGYESEYYPEYFGKALQIMKKNRCDYLILGQHFPSKEIGEKNSAAKHETVEELQTYVQCVVEAINTGKFFYIAHPDVFNFVGDIDLYREKMNEICKVAKAHAVPLEFNLLGFADKRFYPNEEFFKLVAKNGNDVILGVDAHDAWRFEAKDVFDNAYRYADKLKLNIIEPLEPKFLK